MLPVPGPPACRQTPSHGWTRPWQGVTGPHETLNPSEAICSVSLRPRGSRAGSFRGAEPRDPGGRKDQGSVTLLTFPSGGVLLLQDDPLSVQTRDGGSEVQGLLLSTLEAETVQ